MAEQDLNVPLDSVMGQCNNNVSVEHNHHQDTNTVSGDTNVHEPFNSLNLSPTLQPSFDVVNPMEEQDLNVPQDSVMVQCNNNVSAEQNHHQDTNTVSGDTNVHASSSSPNLLPTLQLSFDVLNPMAEQDLNAPPDSVMVQCNNYVCAEHNHNQDTNIYEDLDESNELYDVDFNNVLNLSPDPPLKDDKDVAAFKRIESEFEEC
jgi:hypothetical protein